jgi:hypothetical protein
LANNLTEASEDESMTTSTLRSILIAGLLTFAPAAHAQSVLDITFWTCVGPGIPNVDPQEVVDDFLLMISTHPSKICQKECKSWIKGCETTVKDQGKCGSNFLKSTESLAKLICEGEGGTKNQCKAIKGDLALDKASWNLMIELEKAQCDVLEGICLSRC